MRKKRKKGGSEDMTNQNNGNGNIKTEIKDILHSVRLDPVTGKEYAIDMRMFIKHHYLGDL